MPDITKRTRLDYGRLANDLKPSIVEACRLYETRWLKGQWLNTPKFGVLAGILDAGFYHPIGLSVHQFPGEEPAFWAFNIAKRSIISALCETAAGLIREQRCQSKGNPRSIAICQMVFDPPTGGPMQALAGFSLLTSVSQEADLVVESCSFSAVWPRYIAAPIRSISDHDATDALKSPQYPCL